MAPSGIEPATFRFVAQRLNHCATAVPRKKVNEIKITNVRSALFWDLTQHNLVLLYDISGKLIRPIFKRQVVQNHICSYAA